MRRRWIYVKGEPVEVGADYRPESRRTSYQVMADIKPYRSMIDGRVINSRSHHRDHLKDNGCVEVGNDSSLTAEYKPIGSPPGLKEDLIRFANEKLRSV